jgi:glutaredoxin-related protein
VVESAGRREIEGVTETESTMTALILSLFASAAPTLRTIDGAPVSLSAPSVSLVVFWSMECTECVETMNALEEASLPYVAINTDASAVSSRLRSFARVHDLTAPIVTDADGMLQRDFQVQGEDTFILSLTGAAPLRVSSWDTEALLTQVTLVAGQ